MPSRNISLLLCAIALLLCACGTQRGKAPVALPISAAEPTGLPAPALLLAESLPGPRGVSFSEGDLLKGGHQFEPLLPLQHVSAGGQPQASFNPRFSAAAPAFADLACAVYRFDAEGYDRSPFVRLNWLTEPEPGNLWLALADWQNARWAYFRADENWEVNFGSRERFLKDGRVLYAAVLLAGDAEAVLSSLRLGPVAPTAALSALPLTGSPPLNVSFDAAASTAGEGSIVQYEWDFDNDGVFELDSAAVPQAQYAYAAGLHHARLKVTNSAGLSASVLSEEITVSADWQHSFGRSFEENAADLYVDSAGNIYICGSSQEIEEPDYDRAALIKLNQQGELIWARGWRTLGNSYLDSICGDGMGGIVCAGRRTPDQPGGTRGLLLQWTADGELVGSHDLLRESFIFIEDMFVLEGQLLLGGGTEVAANPDFFAAGLDLANGTVLWSRVQGSAANEAAFDSLLLVDSLNVAQGLAVFGNDESRPVMQVFSVSGSPQGLLALNTSAETGEIVEGRQLLYSDNGTDPALFHFFGNIRAGGDNNATYALSMPLQGDSQAGSRISGVQDIHALGQPGDGSLLICGLVSEGRGWFGSIALADLSVLDSRECGGASPVSLNAIAKLSGSYLICGEAQSAGQPITEYLTQSSSFSASWEGLASSGVSGDCTLAAADGESFDLAPLLTTDSGAGESEMFIARRDLPQ